MGGIDAQPGREVVGDWASGGTAVIDKLQWDGMEVGDGVQVMGDKDGGIQERIGGPRVDQRPHTYRWVVGY